MSSLLSPIAERVHSELMGRLGNEARAYTLFETSRPLHPWKCIFVYPASYGDLDDDELAKYSVLVVVNDKVFKDNLNLFGEGYVFG